MQIRSLWNPLVYLVVMLNVLQVYFIVLVRAVQVDQVTRPTRRTNQIQPEFGQFDCSGGSSPPETDFDNSVLVFLP